MPQPPHGTTVCLVNVPDWLAPYCLFAAGSGGGDVLKSYFKDSSLKTKAKADNISIVGDKEAIDYKTLISE